VATITLIKKLRPVQQAWLDSLDELVDLEDKLNTSVAEQASAEFKSATIMMLILGALACRWCSGSLCDQPQPAETAGW
jgi:hypothetical protein